MKISNILKSIGTIALLTIFGCGGGGGSSNNNNPQPVTAKTTVSGTVSFPSLTALVGKQLPKTVSALPAGTTIQALTIDGKSASSVVTVNNDGTYSITDLVPGVDYVLKATAGNQVLRKLVEKAVVTPNATVTGQDLSAVSTTAVTIASQKLASTAGVPTLVLGDPVTLDTTKKDALSAAIFKDVSPAALEKQITDASTSLQSAITSGDYSAINQQSLVDLVNTLNIVIAALDKKTDPTKLLTSSTASIDVTGSNVKTFSLDTTGAVPQVTNGITNTLTQAVVAPIVTSSVSSYIPPARVQLDISTDVAANTLYGLTLDIVMPADALNVDPAKMFLAGGVDSGATFKTSSYDSANRKFRVIIASAYPLPTGNLITFITDRTSGVTLASSSFSVTVVSQVDSNGTPLTTSLNLTKTVTSSGE